MTRRRLHLLVVALVVAAGGLVGAAAPAGAAPRLRVTVTLAPRDPSALAAYARAVSTPGSADYHRYLTPAAFRARFGARPARIADVRAALRARGLRPGAASAGGLSMSLRATASQLRRAHVAGGGLPRSTRDAVSSVIGLGDGDAARPLAVRAAHRPRHPLRAHAATAPASGPQACPEAAADAPAEGAYTDNEIASAYGFDGLYAAGDLGADTTIAVYELEPDDPGDIAAFQHCYGTDADVSYIHVDGGAGVGAGSDEAAFDIENLIGFAPAAHLLVYQGPNSNSGAPGSGPYDVFSAIINQDRAQVISVSWGQCEAQLGARSARAESVLFEQAAVQGQTIVAAAGDDGAEDCDTGGARSSTARAVDDPSSQPWVTGVGGTSLRALGPPPTETAWNGGDAGAGGGGVSSLWRMPRYQADAPRRLGVRRDAGCDLTGGLCRAVPDVAADADPTTGYEIYWNGADTVPEPSGWQALGGTSGASPLWAALFALADSDPACEGSTVGYAGPALYRAAATDYAADFHDVTVGSNGYEGHDGWSAGVGYDQATGLGTPDATALVGDLCADSLRVRAPADQSSADGAAIAVRIGAAGLRGGRLTWTATHLPPGVSLDAATGRLHGHPTRPGRYRVRVGLRDARGSRAAGSFTWGVGGVPSVRGLRLSGGRLTFAVASGPRTPSLRDLRIYLPAGLRLRDRARVVARSTVAPTVTISGRVVTVSLAGRAPRVAVSLPVTGVGDGGTLSVGVRSGTTGTSVLTARVAS